MTDLAKAPADWLSYWFALDFEVRATIEGHHEAALKLAAFVGNLDIKDRSQYQQWRQVRESSGWTLMALSELEVKYDAIRKYEVGESTPSGDPGIRYRAVLNNLAADQYHRHLTEMAWALFWAERDKKAPEKVKTTKPFLAWCDRQGDHPLLSTLDASIAYDPHITWGGRPAQPIAKPPPRKKRIRNKRPEPPRIIGPKRAAKEAT